MVKIKIIHVYYCHVKTTNKVKNDHIIKQFPA